MSVCQVQDHKTLRKFGKAQVYLDKEEFAWCTKWLELKKRMVATNPYFFSSFGKGQAKDMVRYIRMAWAEMGLPGSPTVLDIRSAVATYVSIGHISEYHNLGFHLVSVISNEPILIFSF